LLLGVATLFGGGVLGVACGPSKDFGDGGGPDSGNDGTLSEAGKDGQPPSEGGPEGGPPGSCEAGITGSCDIVAQNCGTGKECAVVQTDAGDQLACVTNTTGSIKEGYACTPGNSNPCVAGLECILNRCAKHCCFGDDTACGKSQPEGNTGRCDLTISVGSITNAYTACTYSASCEPFDIQPCAATQTCNIKDSNGTAVCIDYASPDGGLPEKTPCKYANDCKDGLICAGNLDGGAPICQWECYTPPGPFDAGITTLGAGKGGCPTGESCKPINWGGTAPTWLGMCGK
jgi:hypothetical protein